MALREIRAKIIGDQSRGQNGRVAEGSRSASKQVAADQWDWRTLVDRQRRGMSKALARGEVSKVIGGIAKSVHSGIVHMKSTMTIAEVHRARD